MSTDGTPPPDVIIDIPNPEEQKMPADIPDDRAELIMSASADSIQSLMHEEMANNQSNDNIARHSGVRKYDGEDPIEAMANAKILKLPNQ